MRGFSDSSLAVDRENGKIVNLLTTEEMLNNLSLAQRIYREDLDIHTELQTAVPVFTIETIPTLEELTVSTAYSDRIRFLSERDICVLQLGMVFSIPAPTNSLPLKFLLHPCTMRRCPIL